MIVVERLGNYKVAKDGTSYYRVFRGRKRIGSFLQLEDASKYMNSEHARTQAQT
ncbi:hypothetical protein [Brevibacillus laterosporus]|uniref:hypothetical protein n=1 Tax=Brevibacillus laterosporus TaxID=1465 RepID=UPI003D236C93